MILVGKLKSFCVVFKDAPNDICMVCLFPPASAVEGIKSVLSVCLLTKAALTA